MAHPSGFLQQQGGSSSSSAVPQGDYLMQPDTYMYNPLESMDCTYAVPAALYEDPPDAKQPGNTSTSGGSSSSSSARPGAAPGASSGINPGDSEAVGFVGGRVGSAYGSVVKNGIPVDSPEHGAEYHVFQEGATKYDVRLNQVNLSRNNNKYYIIQLLEHDQKGPDDRTAKAYKLWTRWGRTGYDGQHADLTFSPNIHRNAKESALAAFRDKFREKTANTWGSVFQPVDGKYTWLQMMTHNTSRPKKIFEPSTLSSDLQELMELICDDDLVDQEVTEIGYDSVKVQLATVGQATITDAFQILEQIHRELQKLDRNPEMLEKLTSAYFTLIPHNMGFKDMKNFAVNTFQKLGSEVTMLRRLEQVANGYRSMRRSASDKRHPHDHAYATIGRKLTPLARDHPLSVLVNYATQNLRAARHRSFRMTLERIFAVEKRNESSPLHNKHLLWFGAPLKDWATILRDGLSLPSVAPKSTKDALNSMQQDWWTSLPFEETESQSLGGPALYFTDCLSYAAWKCCATENDNRGCLMLCEVALGEVLTVSKSRPDLNAATLAIASPTDLASGGRMRKLHSALAVGTDQPTQYVQFRRKAQLDTYTASSEGAQAMDIDGASSTSGADEDVVMSVGMMQKVDLVQNTTFALNEYAVYDTAQVVPRFFCQFEFAFD
ncbi:unnamed protein product [Amoebophrya sp. A25]|nr:unnamed protein product [Amoebophrya sp. A25]|eukprot:GSA25T00001821001.1